MASEKMSRGVYIGWPRKNPKKGSSAPGPAASGKILGNDARSGQLRKIEHTFDLHNTENAQENEQMFDYTGSRSKS